MSPKNVELPVDGAGLNITAPGGDISTFTGETYHFIKAPAAPTNPKTASHFIIL